MCISIEPAENHRRISVEVRASFVLEDALRIHYAIAEAPPEVLVDIHFRDVREWEGLALTCLDEATRSRRVRVALTGLSSHYTKLLGRSGTSH